jgi:hypothetical protein
MHRHNPESARSNSLFLANESASERSLTQRLGLRITCTFARSGHSASRRSVEHVNGFIETWRFTRGRFGLHRARRRVRELTARRDELRSILAEDPNVIVRCKFRGLYGSHAADGRYLRRGDEAMLTLAQARGFADKFEIEESEIAS